MNCQDVQDHLSGYLDLFLDAAQMAAIETHIASCPQCHAETELLRETIQQVRSLPMVDIPLGFTQRVMSHVYEVQAKPGFWQRLALLLTPGAAGPAFALAAAAAISLYLLQQKPDEIVATRPEVPPAVEFAPETQSDVALAPFQLAEAKPDETRPARPKRSRTPATPVKETEEITAGRAKVTPPSRFEGVRPVEKPQPEFDVRPTPVGNQSSGRAGGSSGSGPGSFPVEPELPFFRQGVPTIEPFADLEIVVRRHAASRLVPGGPSEAGASAAPPRPIERLSAAIPDHTRPQTIWVSIPQAQFEEFKREILHLGIIESESRVPMLHDQNVGQSDGHIRVKLTAVPASEKPMSPYPPEQR